MTPKHVFFVEDHLTDAKCAPQRIPSVNTVTKPGIGKKRASRNKTADQTKSINNTQMHFDRKQIPGGESMKSIQKNPKYSQMNRMMSPFSND